MSLLAIVHDPHDSFWSAPVQIEHAVQHAKNRAHTLRRPQQVFKLVQSHHVAAPTEPLVTEVNP